MTVKDRNKVRWGRRNVILGKPGLLLVSSMLKLSRVYGTLAQLAEQKPVKLEVLGSSPRCPAIYWPIT